jgi:hypothetical protein
MEPAFWVLLIAASSASRSLLDPVEGPSSPVENSPAILQKSAKIEEIGADLTEF